jgi:hypothetical protein
VSIAVRLEQLSVWDALHRDEPIVCFTADEDWAPDELTQAERSFFAERQIPLTMFWTTAPGDLDRSWTGVHPNFWPGTTHGGSIEEIVMTMVQNVPNARGFRSHRFFDGEAVCDTFVRYGFEWDSNVSTWLSPRLGPLLHKSGLVRFPVSWEDDAHAQHVGHFDIAKGLAAELSRPGLHVLNLHPVWFGLNLASRTEYARARARSWEVAPGPFRGARDLTEELIELLGDTVRYAGLDELFLDIAATS